VNCWNPIRFKNAILRLRAVFAAAMTLMGTCGTVLAEEGSGAETLAGRSAVDGSLPHGAFFWDYLLTALLIAGALFVVCRSSRRA